MVSRACPVSLIHMRTVLATGPCGGLSIGVEEPAIFSWSLKNEPYIRDPRSGIMGDLWIPYAQFKYGSETNLSAAWSDYPSRDEAGRIVGSNVYLYRLQVEGMILTRKLMLIK